MLPELIWIEHGYFRKQMSTPFAVSLKELTRSGNKHRLDDGKLAAVHQMALEALNRIHPENTALLVLTSAFAAGATLARSEISAPFINNMQAVLR